MFLIQLMKILLLAAFIYMLYNLIRFFLRAGMALNARRAEEERKQERKVRGETRTRGGRDVIELDKDQYHVD